MPICDSSTSSSADSDTLDITEDPCGRHFGACDSADGEELIEGFLTTNIEPGTQSLGAAQGSGFINIGCISGSTRAAALPAARLLYHWAP